MAEAAQLRQLLLRVAAAADEAVANGDPGVLESASAELDGGFRALSGDVLTVLGPEDSSRYLDELEAAIKSVPEAA